MNELRQRAWGWIYWTGAVFAILVWFATESLLVALAVCAVVGLLRSIPVLIAYRRYRHGKNVINLALERERRRTGYNGPLRPAA